MRDSVAGVGLFASGRTTGVVRPIPDWNPRTYLYAGVLCTEVQRPLLGRICETEDVTHVVRGPESVQAAKGRG